MTLADLVAQDDPDVAHDLAADRAVVRGSRTTGHTRGVVVSVVLAVLTVVALCVSISIGDFPIPLGDVVPAVFRFGASDSDFIIRQLRLPRALTAVMVGAAFGVSGAIFQSLARNPLASPDIIGITAGATTSAVFIIIVLHGGGTMVSVGALVGALASTLVIYLLAYQRGVSSYRLVLVGIGVASVLTAITSYLLTRGQIFEVQQAMVWLIGSLNGRSWDHLRPVTLAMVVLFPSVLVLARPLRALQLGDDTARGLGVRVERSRLALVVVAVALAAVATAATGPIAFVAFVAAPIARRLVRAPLTIIPAALVGSLLLLLSDLVARRAFAPTEMPVGVVTGILGAPYLVWLLARANRIGRGG
ncbi:MAG: iron chelate uptake ABC transporter family permease subunit [Actinobacteria bacterium]|nr:iron chelate uptake ABC transporter family permease subunit [Actinomycetota bacterium]